MTAGLSGAFPAIPDRNRLNFSWLMKLRWAQIAGQLVTILGVELYLSTAIETSPLLAIVAVGLLSNLVGAAWFRAHPRVAEWHLGAIMSLDVALLTGLLYFTGGPSNPFSFLYLVQIALAAVVLHALWTWTLVALSLGAFGFLLLFHQPLDQASVAVRDQGMWVALAVASAFIVHFLLRVIAALSQRERELALARSQAVRQDRLASLATMAAGAAHELSTPLATIALVAKELERALVRQGDPAMIEDAQLIREQVGRCRGILEQMSGGPGEHLGEGSESVTIEAVLREALARVRQSPGVRLDLPPSARNTQLKLPPRAVIQALRSLITNAQDASPRDRDVLVAATRTKEKLVVEVIDRGVGMSPEVLARAGEPFFTTKEPGYGMGLGLYLARAVIESVGGRMRIETAPAQGTCVIITIPVQAEPSAAEEETRE